MLVRARREHAGCTSQQAVHGLIGEVMARELTSVEEELHHRNHGVQFERQTDKGFG